MIVVTRAILLAEPYVPDDEAIDAIVYNCLNY